MGHLVYILESQKDKSWYYGQTNNLSSRLERHNKGLEKYTRLKCPWVVYWFKEVDSRSEAMKLERKLKNMKSRKRVQDFIDKDNGIRKG